MKNLDRVFKIFKKHYQEIPLEVFANDPYKTLISTLMSSRTRDETTLDASLRLFEKVPSIEVMDKTEEETLSKLIFPVGFYKTKAKNLKKLAKMILGDFKGKIPETREDLMKLPGVGIKTANLVLNRAFDKPAIAVDTHVHKISNLLGWVKTTSPEKTEKELVRVLPQRYWTDINKLFVSIGRQFTTRKRLIEFLEKEKLLD